MVDTLSLTYFNLTHFFIDGVDLSNSSTLSYNNYISSLYKNFILTLRKSKKD